MPLRGLTSSKKYERTYFSLAFSLSLSLFSAAAGFYERFRTDFPSDAGNLFNFLILDFPRASAMRCCVNLMCATMMELVYRK